MEPDRHTPQPPREEFRVSDHSVTRVTLEQLVSRRVIALVPLTVSPNALTLTGGFCASIAAALLWLCRDLMRTSTATAFALLITAAVALTAYAVFDQLDGMQARRRAHGSPYGDFLDHWVDALIANLIPAPLMLLVGFSAEAVLAMSITVAMTWWANNWETKNCGRRELPSVGGLEFIWVAVMMCTLAAFGGVAAFAYEILGVEVKTLIYAGTLFFLVYAMQKNLAHTRNRLRDFAGPLASVGPIAIWYLASLAQDGTAGQGDVALLAIGLIGTKHAGDLMRHLWMAKRYSSFDLGFGLPAGLLLVVGLAGPGGGAANVVEWVILLALLAIAAGKLVYQAIDTYRCLSGTVIELK